LLQRPGDLAGKIADPSFLSSRRLRNTLKINGSSILQRIKEFSASTPVPFLNLDRDQLEIDIDNDESRQLLETHAFHSLKRLLPKPSGVPVVGTSISQSPRSYQAITTVADLERVVSQLSTSACCAVDTESSGKDSHSAELFGVSISGKEGEAFYVPMFEHGPKWFEPTAIASVLNKLFQGSIKIFGHNLKYDYVLLKRSGINIGHIDFDTMVAAYDCFGDSDLLNLQYLSKRLLGRTIKAHKDMVREGQSLLDVPFQNVVNYACEHAEVTLQLAGVLQQELVRRNVEDQYRNITLPMVRKLGDWECAGMPVDLDRLCRLRDSATDQVAGAKNAVVAKVGSCFNLDSYQEVTAILKMDKVLASVIGFRRVNARWLEELAISHELPRLLVRYHRCQKRLRNIELVIESMQNGRVRPVFSQTSTDHSRLSSVKPRLLDLDMVDDLRSCLPKGLREFCPDARRALSFLATEAADHVLLGDLRTASRSGCFRNFPPLSDGQHFHLLLSFITGVSDYQLCRMFLVDRNAVERILHDFQIRYAKTFLWLGKFRETTAANGFASARGRRRYFDGLRSSDLEKRNSAVHSAVKWLLRW
jgi:DNA polymerase-1